MGDWTGRSDGKNEERNSLTRCVLNALEKLKKVAAEGDLRAQEAHDVLAAEAEATGENLDPVELIKSMTGRASGLILILDQLEEVLRDRSSYHRVVKFIKGIQDQVPDALLILSLREEDLIRLRPIEMQRSYGLFKHSYYVSPMSRSAVIKSIVKSSGAKGFEFEESQAKRLVNSARLTGLLQAETINDNTGNTDVDLFQIQAMLRVVSSGLPQDPIGVVIDASHLKRMEGELQSVRVPPSSSGEQSVASLGDKALFRAIKEDLENEDVAEGFVLHDVKLNLIIQRDLKSGSVAEDLAKHVVKFTPAEWFSIRHSQMVRLIPLLSVGDYKTVRDKEDLIDRLLELDSEIMTIGSDPGASAGLALARNWEPSLTEDVLRAITRHAIEKFKAGGLLKSYQARGGEETVELVHDRFATILSKWEKQQTASVEYYIGRLTTVRGERITDSEHVSDKSFSHVVWRGCQVEGVEFHGVTFKKCDFSGTFFAECVFENTFFLECMMAGVVFDHCTFKGSESAKLKMVRHFDRVNLSSVLFLSGKMGWISISHSRLVQATVKGLELTGPVDIEHSSLCFAHFLELTGTTQSDISKSMSDVRIDVRKSWAAFARLEGDLPNSGLFEFHEDCEVSNSRVKPVKPGQTDPMKGHDEKFPLPKLNEPA